jgi:hypothetical protein
MSRRDYIEPSLSVGQLSWKARGLWHFLASLTDDELAGHTHASLADVASDGIGAVKTGIHELRAAKVVRWSARPDDRRRKRFYVDRLPPEAQTNEST